jgi:hypothetical protein
MLICGCSLAGTQACLSCPRYIEVFGKPQDRTDALEREVRLLREIVELREKLVGTPAYPATTWICSNESTSYGRTLVQ